MYCLLPIVNIAELETKTVTELRDIARDLELSGYSTLKKQDLVFRLLQANTEQQGNIFSAGVLEIVEDGFGFLRQERFLPGNMDVYVSQSQIRRFGLCTSREATRIIQNLALRWIPAFAGKTGKAGHGHPRA